MYRLFILLCWHVHIAKIQIEVSHALLVQYIGTGVLYAHQSG